MDGARPEGRARGPHPRRLRPGRATFRPLSRPRRLLIPALPLEERTHGQGAEIRIGLGREGGGTVDCPQSSMIRRIATVGGLTLVSRLTGFVRDVVMAAILGAGPMADAFFVAFRLPNHFRAIFAEGAFAAAFVPAYARTLEEAGLPAANLF